MAGFIHVLLLINLIKIVISEDCIINNRTPENTWEERLHSYLRCDYDYYIKPHINGTGNINASVKFMLKYFTFDSQKEEFSIQTWIQISWNDDGFKWNPDDFNGITETITTYVWVPKLRLFNSDEDDIVYFIRVPCHIQSHGKVLCVARKHHYVTCRTKMGNWPYDAQKCVLEFGPWAEKGANVTLTFGPRAITMIGADYGAEWMISDYEQEADPNSEKQLRMTFTLERESGVIAAIIIYPSILITVLTVLCLFLDVRNNIRLALIGFSLIVQFECFTEVGKDVPKHSADPPTFLMYLRGSLVLTVVSGFLTLFLGHLCKKEKTPLQWVNRINEFVLNSYGRFLIWPQWEVEEIIMISEDVKFTMDWTNFACIINRVCTFVIIIAYVGLYFNFMPQPIPMTY